MGKEIELASRLFQSVGPSQTEGVISDDLRQACLTPSQAAYMIVRYGLIGEGVSTAEAIKRLYTSDIVLGRSVSTIRRKIHYGIKSAKLKIMAAFTSDEPVLPFSEKHLKQLSVFPETYEVYRRLSADERYAGMDAKTLIKSIPLEEQIDTTDVTKKGLRFTPRDSLIARAHFRLVGEDNVKEKEAVAKLFADEIQRTGRSVESIRRLKMADFRKTVVPKMSRLFKLVAEEGQEVITLPLREDQIEKIGQMSSNETADFFRRLGDKYPGRKSDEIFKKRFNYVVKSGEPPRGKGERKKRQRVKKENINKPVEPPKITGRQYAAIRAIYLLMDKEKPTTLDLASELYTKLFITDKPVSRIRTYWRGKGIRTEVKKKLQKIIEYIESFETGPVTFPLSETQLNRLGANAKDVFMRLGKKYNGQTLESIFTATRGRIRPEYRGRVGRPKKEMAPKYRKIKRNRKETVKVPSYDSSYVQYMEDLQSIPPLMPGEYKKLVSGIKEKNKRARKRLFQATLSQVTVWARKFFFYAWMRNLDSIDVIQEGNLGLLKAVEKWDGKGNFYPYALKYVEGTIKQALFYASIQVGGEDPEAKKIYKMKKISDQLFRKLERNPTAIELGEAMSLGTEEIKRLASMSKYILRIPLSLDMPAYRDDAVVSLGETIPDLSISHVGEYYKTLDLINASVVESMMHFLDAEEYEILASSFGFEDRESLAFADIAKARGESVGHIKKMYVSALWKLERNERFLDLLRRYVKLENQLVDKSTIGEIGWSKILQRVLDTETNREILDEFGKRSFSLDYPSVEASSQSGGAVIYSNFEEMRQSVRLAWTNPKLLRKLTAVQKQAMTLFFDLEENGTDYSIEDVGEMLGITPFDTLYLVKSSYKLLLG